MPSATCLDCAKIKLSAYITVIPVAQTPAAHRPRRARARTRRLDPDRHRRARHRTDRDTSTAARTPAPRSVAARRRVAPVARRPSSSSVSRPSSAAAAVVPRTNHHPPPPPQRTRRTTMRAVLLAAIASVGLVGCVGQLDADGGHRRLRSVGGGTNPQPDAGTAMAEADVRHRTSTPSSSKPGSCRVARWRLPQLGRPGRLT